MTTGTAGGWAVLAVLTVTAATFLMAGGSPAAAPVMPAKREDAGLSREVLGVAVAAGALGTAAVFLLDGTRTALALVGIGGTLGVSRLRQSAARRRQAGQTRSSVVEVGEALVGELLAGRPAPAALDRAAEVWAPLAAVASAARLGADVPTALRRAARNPGAEALADLAAAWQVSERSGIALAPVLAEVVASARAQHAAGRLVEAELASARATARLVAVLPVVTLGLGAGTGARPWQLLLGHPLGIACLATGVGLVLAGLAWIDRLATDAAGPV